MTRGRQSVLFAALLLVAQLLFGVMSGEAMAHAGAQHCGGCPGADSSSMSHETAMDAHTADGGHCGTHCEHDGSPATNSSSGCNSGCAMLGSGHCGSPATPALIATVPIGLAVLSDSFGSDRRSVDLPDSPLFDFLRPPTRA